MLKETEIKNLLNEYNNTEEKLHKISQNADLLQSTLYSLMIVENFENVLSQTLLEKYSTIRDFKSNFIDYFYDSQYTNDLYNNLILSKHSISDLFDIIYTENCEDDSDLVDYTSKSDIQIKNEVAYIIYEGFLNDDLEDNDFNDDDDLDETTVEKLKNWYSKIQQKVEQSKS